VRSVAASLIVTVLSAAPAAAQADFSVLPVEAGDRVRVTPPSGAQVIGNVSEVQPRLLRIDQYRFEPEPGLRIDREGDSLWNGFVIGAAIGAVVGATIAAEACLHGSNAPCIVGGALGYGGAGALIDWLRRGWTRIFQGAPAAQATSATRPRHRFTAPAAPGAPRRDRSSS
jgi:hypothetical protein